MKTARAAMEGAKELPSNHRPVGEADSVIVHGGRPLAGSVAIAGYKHAAVPMLAACVLAEAPVRILNVPDIEDRRVLCDILVGLGAEIAWERGALTVDPGGLGSKPITEADSARVHGTMYLIPTMLGRFGAVDIGRSGGCVFDRANVHGSRPVHHITSVLERFGAAFTLRENGLSGRLPRARYRATRISILDYYDDPALRVGPLASGATKAALLAAAIAEGTSVIEHPLRTPEVAELLAFLQAGGVPIGDEGERVVVDGRGALSGMSHALMSDPMEAFTYAACAAYTGSTITLENLTSDRLAPALSHETEHLQRMGVRLTWDESRLHVAAPEGDWQGVDLEIRPERSVHPDNQPLFSLLLLRAERSCTIVDHVWAKRFAHAEELMRMGAKLQVADGRMRTFPGAPAIAGLRVRGKDLRSTCVLLLAALGINGTTIVEGTAHLRRGYDDLVGKLVRLNADIRHPTDERAT